MMLIINKLAVTFLPAPSVVLFCQLLTSAVAIKLMHEGGLVESDPLIAEKVKPFMLVAIAFLGALYTNVKTLQYANVETFIVFRSSTPILIAFLDYVFFRETVTEYAKLVIADGDIDGRDRVRVYGFEL
jgi:GDP-mannose transporter